MVLDTEWHSSVSTAIPAVVDAKWVIEVLHDHSFLITCSPIVTRHHQQEHSLQSGWVKYEVFEIVDIIPGVWKREISFQCCFQDKADGVVSFLEAPMNVISEATYSVKQKEGSEEWVIDEEIDSSCNVLLKPLVSSNMMPARKKLHLQVIEGAKKRQMEHAREEDRAVES